MEAPVSMLVFTAESCQNYIVRVKRPLLARLSSFQTLNANFKNMNHCISEELVFYQCARRQGPDNIVHNIQTNNSVTVIIFIERKNVDEHFMP